MRQQPVHEIPHRNNNNFTKTLPAMIRAAGQTAMAAALRRQGRRMLSIWLKICF
jgi:hypothetical protein